MCLYIYLLGWLALLLWQSLETNSGAGSLDVPVGVVFIMFLCGKAHLTCEWIHSLRKGLLDCIQWKGEPRTQESLLLDCGFIVTSHFNPLILWFPSPLWSAAWTISSQTEQIPSPLSCFCRGTLSHQREWKLRHAYKDYMLRVLLLHWSAA